MPFVLPNPCGTDLYKTSLDVQGGVGPYQWHVDSPATGWTITEQPNWDDGSHVELSGVANGKTNVHLTITDRLGFVIHSAHELVPRSACYFAHVSGGASGGKLALHDPLLTIDASARLGNNHGVNDFRFSPNGRFLAYRYGAGALHPQGAHLSLFDLSSQQDQALDFGPGVVDAYAWSADSSVLAVALSVNGQSQLAGARPTSTAAGTNVAYLQPTVVGYAIEPNLHWVDSQFVTFFAAPPPELKAPSGIRSLYYTRLTTSAFAAPIANTDVGYEPGELTIAGVANSVFVTSPANNQSTFYSIRLDNTFSHNHRTNFLDPSARFSASTIAKALKVFTVSDALHPFQTSKAEEKSQCPKLLTWAGKRERIACVASVAAANTSHGELRIFEVGTQQNAELVPSTVTGWCLKDAEGNGSCSSTEYDYDEASSDAQPRSFSPSGTWLAFVSSSQRGGRALNWAQLDSATKRLSRKITLAAMASGAPSAFAFSPSERHLLFRNGSQLWSYSLAGNRNGVEDYRIDAALDPAAASNCSDDFVSAPRRWCGAERAAEELVWSREPSTELFAYRKGEQLFAVELASYGVERHPFAAPPCADACSGQFEFQPPSP